MAEENAAQKETELNLEEPVEEQEASEDSSGSRKKIVLIAASAVSLLVVAVAVYFQFLAEPDADEVAAEEELPPIEESVYLEFTPPFIVNLPDRGRQRFLQAQITVRSSSRAAILKLEEHMPAVRHNLSNILSAQTVASIQSSGGIEQVRSEATAQLNKILLNELGSEAIEDVLFTSFVMQ